MNKTIFQNNFYMWNPQIIICLHEDWEALVVAYDFFASYYVFLFDFLVHLWIPSNLGCSPGSTTD